MKEVDVVLRSSPIFGWPTVRETPRGGASAAQRSPLAFGQSAPSPDEVSRSRSHPNPWPQRLAPPAQGEAIPLRNAMRGLGRVLQVTGGNTEASMGLRASAQGVPYALPAPAGELLVGVTPGTTATLQVDLQGGARWGVRSECASDQDAARAEQTDWFSLSFSEPISVSNLRASSNDLGWFKRTMLWVAEACGRFELRRLAIDGAGRVAANAKMTLFGCVPIPISAKVEVVEAESVRKMLDGTLSPAMAPARARALLDAVGEMTEPGRFELRDLETSLCRDVSIATGAGRVTLDHLDALKTYAAGSVDISDQGVVSFSIDDNPADELQGNLLTVDAHGHGAVSFDEALHPTAKVDDLKITVKALDIDGVLSPDGDETSSSVPVRIHVPQREPGEEPLVLNAKIDFGDGALSTEGDLTIKRFPVRIGNDDGSPFSLMGGSMETSGIDLELIAGELSFRLDERGGLVDGNIGFEVRDGASKWTRLGWDVSVWRNADGIIEISTGPQLKN